MMKNKTKETHSIPEAIISLNPENMDFDDKNAVREIILLQHNIIEQMAHEIQELREQNQALKDEINHLKGEKGKPKIKPNVPREENDIHKQKRSKKWKKGSKKHRIKIDRTDIIRVDPDIRPPDAEHKGYRRVPIQNITFKTDNVEYKLERYYSANEKKIYEAELPEGVDGEFGAELKAFIHCLYFACRVPEKKIWTILTESGIIISKGQVSNILIRDNQKKFTKEKEDILKAGMECTNYFHIDDTGARHKGINHYVHVICTALFSAFFIKPRKNRVTIKDILGLKDDEQTEKIMISDDAKQFLLVALYHALCWLHEIRHYKKMNPVLEYHHTQLIGFLTEIWKFYELLKEYKKTPDEQQKKFLKRRFDELFSTKTCYGELDKRIALTRGKKDALLLVLTYPEIPLHNNPAEIALRELVIKKKISYGTRSEHGRIAWENMMSILDTCRKHGVSFFDYVRDIFSDEYSMPRLSTLISEKTIINSTSY